MKKISLIVLSALACWGITSCEQYELPNPPAQSNPEEAVFKSENLVLTSTVSGTISLPAHSADQTPVQLFTLSLTDFPVSSELRIVGEFSADESFAKCEELAVNVNSEDNTVTARAAEIQQVFNSVISKDLVAKDVYVRYSAYAVNGATSVRLGGPDYYYWQGVYNILPIPQENVIEPEYYLVGSFCNWDIKKGVKLKQLSEGNQYDNPDFYIKVDVSEADVNAGGYSWKVVPASGFANNSWEGAFGVADLSAGASSTTGNLLVNPEAETGAYTIDVEGSYMIKANMETRRFEVSLAFDYMWVPNYGASISDFTKMMRLTTTDYIHYEGTLRLSNSFWFTGQDNLRGIVYRPDGDTVIGDDNSFSGNMLIDASSTARMKVPATGLYYVKADIANLTYTGAPVNEIELVGEFNGWDPTTAPALTPNSQKTVWTITHTFASAGEFKFCVDGGWAINYGLIAGAVTVGGGNLAVDEAGTYEITIRFDAFPANISVVKK